MPNLGAGVAQAVNPAVTPTWIFSPNSSASNTLHIKNSSQWPAYIGTSGMNAANSMQIPPFSKPVALYGVTQTLYAASGVAIGTQAGTMSASAVTAGTTAITLTAVVPAGLAAGTTIIVGSTAGTAWEAQVVASTTASSQLTFTSALVSDHVASSPVYLATALPASITVTQGTGGAVQHNF